MTREDTVVALQQRVAELEERIRRMEKSEEAGIESLMRKLLPDDVRIHLRTAQKEQLLALRSMLDHWIERTERAGSEPPRRRESITAD